MEWAAAGVGGLVSTSDRRVGDDPTTAVVYITTEVLKFTIFSNWLLQNTLRSSLAHSRVTFRLARRCTEHSIYNRSILQIRKARHMWKGTCYATKLPLHIHIYPQWSFVELNSCTTERHALIAVVTRTADCVNIPGRPVAPLHSAAGSVTLRQIQATYNYYERVTVGEGTLRTTIAWHRLTASVLYTVYL